MSGRGKASRVSTKPSVRGAISVFGALLVASVFNTGFASAMSLGETAGAAESVVTPITETSSSSLPDPATPTAPVVTPAAPQLPVKAPSAAAPTSSSSSNVAATLNSVTTGAAGTATSTSREAAQPVSASARNGSHADSDSNRQGAAQGRDPRTSGNGEGSIDPAEVAPLHWFFIHVWAAIALGRDRALLTTLLERLEGTTSLPPTDAARLLTGFSGASRPSGDRTLSAAHSAKPNGLLAVLPATGTEENYRVLIWLALVVLGGSFVVWAESRRLPRPHDD
jgi:LPXTG-motif cell wall-anchored protein